MDLIKQHLIKVYVLAELTGVLNSIIANFGVGLRFSKSHTTQVHTPKTKV